MLKHPKIVLTFRNHPKKLGNASLNIQIKLCRMYPEFINFGTNVAIYVCLCLTTKNSKQTNKQKLIVTQCETSLIQDKSVHHCFIFHEGFACVSFLSSVHLLTHTRMHLFI